jgi:small subunit ribosomal protein S16
VLFDLFFESEPIRKTALMALKIRLSRIGSSHQPHYRIVVAETRSRRDGDAVETVGKYDPRTKNQQVQLRLDRVDYWIAKGAKPTETLHALIKRARRGASTAPAAPAAPEAAPAKPAETAAAS